jgi:hypothetical protein
MPEPKQQPPYPLRMPDEMRSHLEDMATVTRRSLNAQLLAMLEDHPKLEQRVAELEQALQRATAVAGPPELMAALQEAASQSDRSVREEIVRRLEDSLNGPLAYLPTELRKRVEVAANEVGRSTTAECIERIQLSFDAEHYITHLQAANELVAMKSEELSIARHQLTLAESERDALRGNLAKKERLIEDMVAQFKRVVDQTIVQHAQSTKVIDSQRGLLQMLGFYLREVAGRVQGDEQTSTIMELLAGIGHAVANDKVNDAAPFAQRLVELGTQMGIVGDDGKTKPQYRVDIRSSNAGPQREAEPVEARRAPSPSAHPRFTQEMPPFDPFTLPAGRGMPRMRVEAHGGELKVLVVRGQRDKVADFLRSQGMLHVHWTDEGVVVGGQDAAKAASVLLAMRK